ncbi:hypothetical protein [Burkholderia vietnamiensis]|uniref:hypothetical protein n=1 Tax=Burkholderia vietnamiensis TaxID=60552 RepID=UPI001CF4A646|nr:hypothetical protein [Burkholderia vietnamiensis]MCA8229256.1 hypothetical protein [Burkholderia vietnamiensis]
MHRPTSDHQLESVILGCIKRSAEHAKKYNADNTARGSRAADFVVCLCGALEAHGCLELAKEIAAGAGMEHLYPTEGA